MLSYASLGGKGNRYGLLDEIIEYEPSTGEWSLVEQMFIPRESHAVSIISAEDIQQFC